MPGPAPKRGPKAGHHPEHKRKIVETFSTVPVPDPKPDWRPEVVHWYASLNLSGQSRYYEASDWDFALAAGDLLEAFYAQPYGNTFKVWMQACSNLGVTEADRRRMRIEVNRPVAEKGEPGDLIRGRFEALASGE